MTLWKVKADAERDHWECVPFVGVGPLRFGISRDEAVGALARPEGATASGVRRGTSEIQEIEYRDLTMYFADGRLFCVAIDALVGPQVAMGGAPLVGRVPSEVEQWVLDYADRNGLELRYTHAADPHLPDLGLIVRAQRAGDVVLSRPVFLDDRAEVSWDYVPLQEWRKF